MLGSNSFIPGFEDGLVGAVKGKTIDVKVTFPDDYQAKNLAGKKANFETTINEIKEDVDVKIEGNQVVLDNCNMDFSGVTEIRVKEYTYAHGYNNTEKAKLVEVLFNESLTTNIKLSSFKN